MPTTLDNQLTTLTRLKSYLGITSSSQDAKLTKLIIGVSQFVQRYCRRKFATGAVVELYNGNGGKDLFLNANPVSTSPALTLERRSDYNNSDSWETVSSELYFIDYTKGKITMEGCFWEGTQNYRVSYTGGYILPSSSSYQDGTDDDKDLPYDLEMCVWDIIALQLNTSKSKGVSRERVRDVDVTYMKALKDDPMIKNTLDSFRRMIYR